MKVGTSVKDGHPRWKLNVEKSCWLAIDMFKW